MTDIVLLGLLIPFLGTAAGAACVFLTGERMNPYLQKGLLGFASGVMVAASVWSLIIPAMDMSAEMGKMAFLPSAIGVAGGMLFLWLMDRLIPHLHLGSQAPEGPHSNLGALAGEFSMNIAGALALAIGIAIQNFPEGAVISLPLRSEGASRKRAFGLGVLSGIVEPLGGLITIWLASYITPALPYLLAFAAGSMLYVVVEELIPESAEGNHSNVGTFGFGVGFILMMILDVALG